MWLVQELATRVWLVLMWVRVSATRVWLVPPLVQKLVQQLVLVSATRVWLVLMWVRVLATQVWVAPLLVQKSVPRLEPVLGLDHPHSTRPHTRRSPHTMYLLGEMYLQEDTLTSPSW